jgi:arylsulfatase
MWICRKLTRTFSLVCAVLFFLGVARADDNAAAVSQQLPNVLLIVADDMGYSDCGCFGGEIDTPAIDSIAAGGVRFTDFFVNPMCTVTRTSLLTGHEHSQSGEYRHSIPIAKMMRTAGYRTSVSGKWHQPVHPLDAGFDSFYGFLKGEINGWLGTYCDNKTLAIQTDREAARPVSPSWYCSDAFADDAIEQIDAAVRDGKPFFTYVPFNAPHGPLHAPEENVVKYHGRFDAGWDVLREKRIERMRQMGLIDGRYRSNQPEAEADLWEEISAAEKSLESRRFCAYAGMVDRMDQNIGRLLEHLEKRNLTDDTIVIFFSDNGGNYSHGSIKTFAQEVPWAPRGPRPACATGWARLMNTPFSWYKTSAFRGGVSSPLIIRWPGQKSITAGSIQKHRLHVSDIYPTLLEIIGQSYPGDDGALGGNGSVESGKTTKPLYGKSFLSVIKDSSLPNNAVRENVFWGFENITKGLMAGDWKIASINDSPWKLFNLSADPSETKDLADKHPERVQQLESQWYRFAKEETDMPADWKRPLNKAWQGWGLHRVRMTMPLKKIEPACSATEVGLEPKLKMTFDEPIDFEDSQGKLIQLFAVGRPETPVWKLDPDVHHPAQGQHAITFALPKLAPSTSYYLLTDIGWAKFGEKPARGLNEGAYFYRFRTAPAQ